MAEKAQEMQPNDLLCLDEYNDMLLTGIRACAAASSKLSGTWAMAVDFLKMVEARWTMGPGVEGGHADWRAMSTASRASRRQDLADCVWCYYSTICVNGYLALLLLLLPVFDLPDGSYTLTM